MTPASTASRPLFVVPHTHWDREWYRTFESYRYRLVQTLDRVLASDLPYFLLDGQTVVLDDYLAMRPAAEGELRRRIAEGRLGVGPWYVLVDEFLVSGEALVRNLLVGRADMARFGAAGAVGYLPDMFGHIGQMPQILAGFGLETAVVWRGANPPAPRFRWQAPDGSEVTTAWLPLGYYQPMFLEGHDPAALRAQVAKYLEGFAGSDAVWLLSGADHMAPRADLVAQLASLNAGELGVEARVATLREVLAGPRPEAVVAGELRDNAKSYLLPGVLSARTSLKQANARCQTLLEQYAEPLTALAWAGGSPYPGAFMAHAWKELMKNHPHDSICGCSIDQVHREMMPRFAAVEQVAEELLGEAVGLDRRPVPAPRVFVYAPAGHAGWIEVGVDWPLAGAPEAVHLVDAEGRPVPTIGLSAQDTERFCAEIDFNPDWFPVRRFRLAARPADLAVAGAATLAAVPGAPEAVATALEAADDRLENPWIRLRVAGGQLELLDKGTGEVFADCHRFLDEGDAGDEYNFSPLADDVPVESRMTGARLVAAAAHAATLELCYELTVPEALAADRKRRSPATRAIAVVSRFTLGAEARMVEVETVLDNRVLDHRLRVVVPFGSEQPEVWSEGTFGVFRRAIVPAPALPVPKGVEAIMPEFPQGRFTALAAGGRGLAIANRGLPEAAVIPHEGGWAFAMTLLRAVGWLSRDDLATRGGGAGPRFETPEAQCLGEQRCHYALVPGGWQSAMGPALAFASPPRAWVGAGLPVNATVDLGHPAVVLSALKRSEDGKFLVVRGYNAGPEAVEAALTVHLPHRRVLASDVAETPGEEVGQGPYRLRPYEIRTWLVDLG